MAEADGIGAAGRDDQVGDRMESTLHTSCEALAVVDDVERLETYATAPLEEADTTATGRAYLNTFMTLLQRFREAVNSKYCSPDDEYVTARRRKLEHLRSECGSDAEFEMAKSREHWTVVGGPLSSLDLVCVANRQHFQRLLDRDALLASDPRFLKLDLLSAWKLSFFVEYGDGQLVVGEKIGEGGQAEIFKATLHGRDEYVLKAFKPDFSLGDLERHWTIRLRDIFYFKPDIISVHCCFIETGTLLKDGRFAFVMKRYWGDLRKLIDQNMLANNGRGPPFPPRLALYIMSAIAVGMQFLHSQGILHRDLKASNVLIKRVAGHLDAYVIADFESSGGALGTRFWRAPEVLQAVKDKVKDPNVWKNIWSKKVDVYGYAMTSYEALTGRIRSLSETSWDMSMMLFLEVRDRCCLIMSILKYKSCLANAGTQTL